jgi:Flp pilus assembly pilin Flp
MIAGLVSIAIVAGASSLGGTIKSFFQSLAAYV